MKNCFYLLCLAGILAACVHAPRQHDNWELVWEEDFSGNSIDTAVWSRIPRGTPDWMNTQSHDDRCYAFRDGCIVLRGIVNTDLEADTAHYLTGGIYSKGKHAFQGGRVDVRARLHGARGAWPAIWMLPFHGQTYHWPDGGEIDLMERLNDDSIVYQTVHSHYITTLKQRSNPPQGGTYPIVKDDFNIYSVEFASDSLIFYVNYEKSFVYPRIETELEGQFPFDLPYFLLIDMQLGGAWVGEVEPADLPVEMEVDWVRHYQKHAR